MLQLIGKMLHENGIGFAQLTGKVAVKNRGKLIRKFEEDPHCKIFLSSHAGGSGLNLQVANTVINFELPWNPAKRNQRIGRINRLGQKHKHLTVIDFITNNSIEIRIASGLGLKQNLFEGVLNTDSTTDFVDFSEAGRSQFLQELQESISDFLVEDKPEEDKPEWEEEKEEDYDLDIVETQTPDEESHPPQPVTTEEPAPASTSPSEESAPSSPGHQKAAQAKEMEQVMNQGLDFLSGLFKMATGKDSGLEGKKMEYDEETGEVVMRFKLPDM